MKKLSVLIISLILALTLGLNCFAATGISNAEKQILNTVDRGGVYSEEFYEYENALRNYFNRDYISAGQTDADVICKLLNNLYRELGSESPNQENVIKIVVSICNQLKLKMIYNRATGTADIVGRDHTVIIGDIKMGGSGLGLTFNTHPYKETGTSNEWVILLAGSLAFALAGVATVVIYNKKKGKLDSNGKSSV